ncbi:WYL domain-containing protein [Actinospica durhamensis]|uniref:WYL domain-containing protein n=1 Tax=Actinospica durhamensis TaxID=1508375 RepID=A0A941ISU0_9ACTN|nr:WYL domain-containing protein [Actinospica durhamensis]MBR7836787.1 WYL domain-containing protein [Actinospica durhamensis]
MRASRLLSLVLLLQNRGRMTASELAESLEVSVRTIYRDVESLSAAGVPVYGEPGHAGGYALVEGYRTRLTGLHGDEIDALSLAGLPGPAAELGLGSVLTVAQLKLDAALPAPLRERSGRIRERFHLDAPAWYRDADPVPHLTAAADAVWNERRLRVRYRRWAEPREVDRTLDPLGIVLKAGIWYLVAASTGPRASGSIRTYRISQILHLAEDPDQAAFRRPTAFDLAEYWQSSLAEFDQNRFQGTATVRLSPEAVRRMADLYTSAVLRSVEQTASAPDHEGWIRAEIPVESTIHALGEVFKLGWGVEVLDPPDLRAKIAEYAADLARLHR